MAYEGAPEPADKTEVLRYKIAKGIWNLLTNGSFSGLTDGQLRATPVPVSAKPIGATNLTTSQVTAGAVATLVSARATRVGVLIRNNGTGTDEIAVGEATVSTTHGTRLKAGESCQFTFTGLIQVLAITGTPIVTAADEYN